MFCSYAAILRKKCLQAALVSRFIKHGKPAILFAFLLFPSTEEYIKPQAKFFKSEPHGFSNDGAFNGDTKKSYIMVVYYSAQTL